MQVLILVALLVCFAVPVPAFGYDVLILQSLPDKGYQEAVQGFKKECSVSARTVVLSDFAGADVIRMVREERPKLIVAVGDRALDTASRVRELPIVFMMVLNSRHRGAVNATGVSMLIDPSRYVSVFDSANARRVGIIYDPLKTGAYLKKAHAAAKRSGISLVTREVRTPKDTPAMLDSLRGRVDAVWMLPDLTAVSSETTEAYFLFSQGEMVPVVTFSEVYLSMGGAFSLNIDRFDIGRQAGDLARGILAGTPVEELPVQFPRKSTLKTNAGVLKRLRIAVPGGGS